LGSDLEALAGAHGAPLLRYEVVSRHRATRETRETFRLDFADGSVLKGRRVRSAASAARIEAIVSRLDPARFPRVVARRGTALLEEWIPGEALDRLTPEPAHVRWAAETLAGVHRLEPLRPRGRHWLEARITLLERHLGALAAGGAVPEADARRLLDAARAHAPRKVDFALIHRDVCPENIVVDPGGRLYCVDNATARGGAPDEDLARTCYRWPLDARMRDVLLDAYRAHRDPEGFVRHRKFWMIAALAHASWIRHSRCYARADVPVRRLMSQLAEASGETQEPCSICRTGSS